MKTVSARKFYHNFELVDGLAEGSRLVVTAKGRPKFAATKSPRPKMTRARAEELSVGDSRRGKFDGVAFPRTLKNIEPRMKHGLNTDEQGLRNQFNTGRVGLKEMSVFNLCSIRG